MLTCVQNPLDMSFTDNPSNYLHISQNVAHKLKYMIHMLTTCRATQTAASQGYSAWQAWMLSNTDNGSFTWGERAN